MEQLLESVAFREKTVFDDLMRRVWIETLPGRQMHFSKFVYKVTASEVQPFGKAFVTKQLVAYYSSDEPYFTLGVESVQYNTLHEAICATHWQWPGHPIDPFTLEF